MQESSLKQAFTSFFARITYYTDLLLDITETKPVTIQRVDKKEIYEAFVLKVYVTWEMLVEDLLFFCLAQDISRYARHEDISLPKDLSRDVCERLVRGLRFFDVHRMSDIGKLAGNILVPKYNPFPLIDTDDRKTIDEFYTMRNYLAHNSCKSKSSLFRIYNKVYGLTHFLEPGYFLLESDRGTKQIRFASYIDSFTWAAEAMAKFLANSGTVS